MLDPSLNPPALDAPALDAAGPPTGGLIADAAGAPAVGGRPPSRVGAWLRAIVGHALRLARPQTAPQRALLVAIVVVDLALMAAFVAFAYAEHYGIRSSPFYGNLKFSFVDGSYPEMFGYAKQVFIVLLLLGAWRTRRQPVYPGLALLFAVAVLDDAFALHETWGRLLADNTAIPLVAAGPVVWGVMGLVPLIAVFLGYRRSDAGARADAAAVIAGFAVLLFFAVGMDAFHAIVEHYVHGFQTVMTLSEDGGELLTLTFLCAVALGIFRRSRAGAAHPPL